jgi:GNAT superfamily N-acetyltransferase
MTAYRFCRSDDLALLADAYERCRGPEDAAEAATSPALDRAGMKVLIRESDLWSSSCMIANESGEPVAVLLGCKRVSATLVHALRVHPQHRRRGHARHLLTSLSSKLAILGPPRLVAEVPSYRPAALSLFEACGWRREAPLVDFRRERRTQGGDGARRSDDPIAPLAIEEALASGLLPVSAAGWRSDPESFLRQADRLGALGFYSADRLEAIVVHRALSASPPGADLELLALGATDHELGKIGLARLLDHLENAAAPATAMVLPRQSRAESVPTTIPLFELSFQPVAEHFRYATEAKPA